MCSQPPDGPKPPEPYETWLDAVLSGPYVTPQRWQEHACAELEELRSKAEQAGKCQKCQALLHIRCPDCAGVREPP